MTEWWQKKDVVVPSLFQYNKSVGAIIGRPLPIFLLPPLSRDHYKVPLLEEWWHVVTEWWYQCPRLPFSPHTNSLRATNGRPYETLAVLQYKATQKGDQRPPYEIFII